MPYWGFPALLDGWDLTTFDEDGVNQLTAPSGCLFTSYQGVGPRGAASADRKSTEAILQEAFASYPDAKVGVAEVTKINGVGGPVEFLTVEATYTTSFPVTSRIAMRVVGESGSLLSLQYACPSEAYIPSQWDELMSETTVFGVAKNGF